MYTAWSYLHIIVEHPAWLLRLRSSNGVTLYLITLPKRQTRKSCYDSSSVGRDCATNNLGKILPLNGRETPETTEMSPQKELFGWPWISHWEPVGSPYLLKWTQEYREGMSRCFGKSWYPHKPQKSYAYIKSQLSLSIPVQFSPSFPPSVVGGLKHLKGAAEVEQRGHRYSRYSLGLPINPGTLFCRI